MNGADRASCSQLLSTILDGAPHHTGDLLLHRDVYGLNKGKVLKRL